MLFVRCVCRVRSALLAVMFLLANSAAGADPWPQFRGPTGMGLTTDRGLPTIWGGKDDTNVLWKVALPGLGEGAKADHNQSSPIVWGERVFLITAIWPQGRDHREFPDQHVACYRTTDGQQLWDRLVPPGLWKLGDLRGGYGAPTPATDGERLYVLFGSGVLAALDFEGQPLWRQELTDVQSFDVAIASSPIVFGDTVILLADKIGGKGSLIGYDRRSGEVRWEEKRPKVTFNHSTPTIADIGGRRQLLIGASNSLQGVDPENGKLLWWFDTPGDVCSPVYAGGVVYSDSGRGGPGVLVEPRGEGALPPEVVKWRIGNIPEGLSSPAIVGDYLYRMHNPAVLKCWKLADGKEAYATRLDGASVSSSPIVTPEDNIYFASAGKTFVVLRRPAVRSAGDQRSGRVEWGQHCRIRRTDVLQRDGAFILRRQQTMNTKTLIVAGTLLSVWAWLAPAARCRAPAKQAWVPISHQVTSEVKPGYPGKTAGVTVDPETGAVFMVVPDQGIWKSTDHGQSFQRVDDGKIGGRCETGFALDFDPAGKRLACFMIYGSSAWTADVGKTWTAFKTSHLDFGAVDSGASGKCLIALRHESGGQLCYSADEAQTWTNLDKGFVAVGIFDAHTLLSSKGKGLVRSDDAGQAWTQVSDVDPAGRVMRVYKGVGYWTTDRGLLVSKDQGRTWTIQGQEISAVFGPYFGKNADHMVIVGKQGFHETRDGGQSWQVVAPLPPEFGVGHVGPNYAWDPQANIFYASSMGKDTLKFERPAASE